MRERGEPGWIYSFHLPTYTVRYAVGIFKYTRRKKILYIDGTGLGFSIVKHGVTFLGGTVCVESEEGIGTSFSVVFPKNRPEETKAEPEVA